MSNGSCAASATLLRAILIEARNAAIYNSLAQLFQGYDTAVEAVFREMAREESQHGVALQELYRDQFGLLPVADHEPMEVIEGPDLEDAETFIFDSMTVDQALETGLRAENEAREFYKREASRISEPQLRQMYYQLAEFEQTHVRLLQEKLAERRGAAGAVSA